MVFILDYFISLFYTGEKKRKSQMINDILNPKCLYTRDKTTSKK